MHAVSNVEGQLYSMIFLMHLRLFVFGTVLVVFRFIPRSVGKTRQGTSNVGLVSSGRSVI